MCEKWNERTPEGFRFFLKATKTITHDNFAGNWDGEWHQFMDGARVLGKKLGGVVWQFPQFSPRSHFSNPERFMDRMAKVTMKFDTECPWIIEVRNPEFLTDDFIRFCRMNDLTLCLTDMKGMPRPAELWARFHYELKTHKFVYIRFLGDREGIEKQTKTWNKVVIDRTPDMNEWVPFLKKFLDKEIPVAAIFNNHYAGHAPGSIELLRRTWDTGFSQP